MRLILANFRIVDSSSDFSGSLIIENGIIKKIIHSDSGSCESVADIVIDGSGFGSGAVLMPSFIDLHAHFRDPGFPEKETLESASLASVAGGFTTIVCMANTNPVIDNIETALALKERSDKNGLIDLYPVLSLTKNMEGRELSGINGLFPEAFSHGLPLLISEDGKDVAADDLFFAAMAEAKRIKRPVSCHCDFGGTEAEEAKKSGRPREEWSRIEENNAVRRAIDLGKKSGCHIHIAHVSTKEAADIIRKEKKNSDGISGFTLTCEASPHHIGATEEDAHRMGNESFGRVNPPLRTEGDRLAIIRALNDGTIDAIATDHAPHSEADKSAGSPGFTGLETAFAASLSFFAVSKDVPSLQKLSSLLSGNPAKILGLQDRGRIEDGLRADIVIADIEKRQRINPQNFLSKGKCTPFAGKDLCGKILMTIKEGKIVFDGGRCV